MVDIQWLLIDLDETLYPPESGIWQAIALRINEFMALKLRIPHAEIPVMRDHYYRTYGTTLNGLIAHHDVDPIEYMDFVHDIPIEQYLTPNKPLQEMLLRIPQRKAIFTNADRKHVNRVTNAMGINSFFEEIIDLLTLELINKPQLLAYKKALAFLNVEDPRTCMIVDDQARNLIPAKEVGMATVLVGGHVDDPGIDINIPSIIDLLSSVPELSLPSHHRSNEL